MITPGMEKNTMLETGKTPEIPLIKQPSVLSDCFQVSKFLRRTNIKTLVTPRFLKHKVNGHFIVAGKGKGKGCWQKTRF